MSGRHVSKLFDTRRRDLLVVLTSEEMALEMLQVQVRLVAMRTLILALSVLGRVGDGLSDSRAWAARVGRQHTATSLLSYDVNRLGLLVGEDGRVRVELGVRHTHAGGAHILKTRQRTLTEVVGLRSRGGEEWSLRVRRGERHV